MRIRIATMMAVFIILSIMVSQYNVVEAAEKMQKELSVSEQLSEIMQTQKRIEQRLMKLESSQNTIIKVLQSSKATPPQRPKVDYNKVYNLKIEDSPFEGKKNAKVTITEFSEVQCPYSQRFYPVIKEVLKAYPNEVKHVFKNFPLYFHAQAKPAAKASLAAGEQGKYWEMLDLLFENGKNLTEDKYKEFAAQIGLNVNKFEKDLKEKDVKWEEIIKKDMELAKQVNVSGTPTCFINGKRARSRDLDGFKKEIDAILKKGGKK